MYQKGVEDFKAINAEFSDSVLGHLRNYQNMRGQFPSPPPEDPQQQLIRKFGQLQACKDELTAMLVQEQKLATYLAPMKAQQNGIFDSFHGRLEELLGEANLLDKERPDDGPQIHLPPPAETQAAMAQIAEPVPSSPSEVPSIELLFRRTTFEELGSKWGDYRKAASEFQRHQESYTEYYQGFQRDKELGRHDCTSGNFAQVYVQDGREATRALIDAEAQLLEVEARARALRIIQNGPQQAFDFVDRSDDGYGENFDAYMSSAVNRPRIWSWLEETRGCEYNKPCAKALQDQEIDEWACKSVELWESYSQVADGRWREEIDKLRARERPRYNLRRR